MRGQVPVAFVVPTGGLDTGTLTSAIREGCAAALADFKVPRHIRIVEDMPRTGGAAKISKPELRRWVEGETGG